MSRSNINDFNFLLLKYEYLILLKTQQLLFQSFVNESKVWHLTLINNRKPLTYLTSDHKVNFRRHGDMKHVIPM